MMGDWVNGPELAEALRWFSKGREGRLERVAHHVDLADVPSSVELMDAGAELWSLWCAQGERWSFVDCLRWVAARRALEELGPFGKKELVR